jgi:hypothetical protein
MSTYYINHNTHIDTNHLQENEVTTPVMLAINRFPRDMKNTLSESDDTGMNIVLNKKEGEVDSFRIYGKEESIIVEAADASNSRGTPSVF